MNQNCKLNLNKKILIITIILLVCSITAIVIFFNVRNNKALKKYFDNTINLNSYNLDIAYIDTFTGKNEELTKFTLIVDKKEDIGTVIHDNRRSSTTYGSFMINGYKVIENDKFVREGFNDKYFYYYEGCFISDSNDSDYIIEDIKQIIKKISKMSPIKEKDKYTYDITNDKTIKELISDFEYVHDDKKYSQIIITFTDKYIDTIKIMTLEERFTEIKISNYNTANITIPEEIQKSLAHNYFDFLVYGIDKKGYSNHDRNAYGIYDNNENTCPDGKSKLSFIAKSSSGFFEQYIEVNDCNGNQQKNNIFIKNTTNNYLINDNHSNDIYIIYDEITNKEIGKFTYDKTSDTIKIYDSIKYNGTFLRRK